LEKEIFSYETEIKRLDILSNELAQTKFISQTKFILDENIVEGEELEDNEEEEEEIVVPKIVVINCFLKLKKNFFFKGFICL